MRTKLQKHNIVGVKELRQNLDKYISQISKGKTFTVVRRSKPVFKISPIDVWGDEGVWETVLDFQKINAEGVAAKDVLKALRRIDG